MSAIDHFKAFAPDGRPVSIVTAQVVDDTTWFECYANGRTIGKLHWRADIDAYIALDRNGVSCGSSALFADAEDLLVHEAGYAFDLPVVETGARKE